MTIESASTGPIQLTNVCSLEDAEVLLRLLLAAPGRPVDWTTCHNAHTAIIQVLLALKPPLHGPPAGAFLRTFIEPHIRSGDIVGA